MPAGLARMTYWPVGGMGFHWVVESKNKNGWNGGTCMNITSVRRRAVLVALAVALAAPLLAQTAPKIQFTEATLANGLRVIISEDRAAPVYSIAVHYNVGSRDERKGRTGFAHLFEHMMFRVRRMSGPASTSCWCSTTAAT